MLSTVYRLREGGIKLAKEEVRARGVPGWLEVKQNGGWPEWHARFYSERPAGARYINPLFEIRNIRLVQIDGGILLSGFERPVDEPQHPQSWWCVPTTEPQPKTQETQVDARYEEIRAAVSKVDATGAACTLSVASPSRLP